MSTKIVLLSLFSKYSLYGFYCTYFTWYLVFTIEIFTSLKYYTLIGLWTSSTSWGSFMQPLVVPNPLISSFSQPPTPIPIKTFTHIHPVPCYFRSHVFYHPFLLNFCLDSKIIGYHVVSSCIHYSHETLPYIHISTPSHPHPSTAYLNLSPLHSSSPLYLHAQ